MNKIVALGLLFALGFAGVVDPNPGRAAQPDPGLPSHASVVTAGKKALDYYRSNLHDHRAHAKERLV